VPPSARRRTSCVVDHAIPSTGAVEAARKLEAMGAAGDLNGADALTRELVAGVQSLCDSARAWLDAGAAPS
jgi:hypothetical protein